MGLIYQINGIAFFMLGIVLYMLPRQNTVFRFTKYFWLLSLFGVLKSTVEFLELQRLYVASESRPCVSSEWLADANRILLLFAFIPLLEFGRRIFVNAEGFPRLSAVLIYSIVTFGVILLWSSADDPIIGLAAGARIFIGFWGSLLTAFGLFLNLKTLPKYLCFFFFKFWISLTALAFICHGVLSLFLTHHDIGLPNWLFDQMDFFDWFGFPIQLPRAICAMLITVGFVLLIRRINEDIYMDASVFNAKNAIVITDSNSVILKVNGTFSESTGYSPDELIGQKINLIKSDQHDESFYEMMWASILKTGSWTGEIWDKRKNGEIYPKWLTVSAIKNDAGTITHYIGTHIDISSRKVFEEEIRYLAFYDFLTGLPNRRLLMDRLRYALSVSYRHGKKGALLFIDMDNFKSLNDTLGHDMGDLLLQQIAVRLTSSVREIDTVSRLGGDEFVVMLEDLNEQSAEAFAEVELIGNKILAILNQNYQLGIHDYHSTPSIGVTFFDGHDKDMNALIKQADEAMYQAKRAGRNTLRFYDSLNLG
jgi:diguanylate cyclase (GGDEF)-like protein/PAS domain S-box-containing protein